MDGMSCQICGNRIVIKGISLVCTGCGNATRSNHIFSTEQDFQKNNIKRTTQHIKQRQDKGVQVHQSLQEHLKLNWLKYLKGFSKFIIHLGSQLNLDIKPLYLQYLQQYMNQPINSNWTVARRGHQGFSKNRVINSRYKKLNLNDSIAEVKVEEEQDHDFENQLEKHFTVEQLDQSDVQIVQQLRKKIKKPKIPFYERRQIKYQLTHRQKDAMQQKRKQSSNRKGSNFVDMPILSDKKGFIQQAIVTLSLTNPIYLALIELYFDKFYHEEPSNLNQEINKIKNIKTQNRNHSKYIKIQIIQQEIFANMPPFLQMEMIFLQDFLMVILEASENFSQLIERWTKISNEISHIKKRNVQFITRKLKKINQYLQNAKEIITTQETDITFHINGEKFNQKADQMPLDFTFGLVLIYATNLMTSNSIYPSKLIQQIKQKKLSFLDGFSRFMNNAQYQYLTVPQHIPKPSYIRENAKKLLKNLKIQYEHHNKEQLLNMFQSFCLEMDVSQDLYSIAMSFEDRYLKDYHVDNSLYDIYCCCLLLLGFKYYLVINKEEAVKCLAQICKTSKNIQPWDYADLEECDIEEIRQSLEQQCKLDGYYGNRLVNEKLNQKLQEVENFFDSQIIPEYHQQQQYQIKIENAVKVEIVHEDWDFYKTPDFDWEAPELRYFLKKLSDYLDEEENIIIAQYHEMEKHVV